jgi:Sodium/hydrogen exchanger family
MSTILASLSCKRLSVSLTSDASPAIQAAAGLATPYTSPKLTGLRGSLIANVGSYEGTRTNPWSVRRGRDPGGRGTPRRSALPGFLALGGALLAFLPGAPSFSVPPELALALFVAPALLDAAYDASLRDLRDNWAPVTSLVVFAVGFTTAAVAIVAHTLIPTMPWAAAIALGAIVAPPDAVAATAVLRPLRPPHRILTILEGEAVYPAAQFAQHSLYGR